MTDEYKSFALEQPRDGQRCRVLPLGLPSREFTARCEVRNGVPTWVCEAPHAVEAFPAWPEDEWAPIEERES